MGKPAAATSSCSVFKHWSFQGQRNALLLLFFMMMAGGVRAQQNHTFYFMQQVPQASIVNPAYASPCTYLGLPLVSSIHTNLGHTGFSYNQLFPKNNGRRGVDVGYLENRLHRLDLFNSQVHLELLSGGIPFKDYFFSFRVSEKISGKMSYPRQLFVLPWKGNSRYTGQTASIDRLGGDVSYYREYALSASRWVSDDLRLGIRGKLLFGKLNLSTRRENLRVTTGSENYHIDVNGRYQVNASMPLQLETDSADRVSHLQLPAQINWRKLLFNSQNPGLAMDVGAVYTGLDHFTLYASLLNLGGLRWSSNLNNLKVKQSFQFEGLSQEDLNASDYMGMMRDSLKDSYQMNHGQKSYFTWLPLHTYIGMSYQFNDYLQAGILEHHMLYKWRIYPSFTLSLNGRVGDFLSLSASYSYNNYSFRNLGLGFSIQTDHWQFYAAADNLLGMRPLNVRNVNLRWGFNLFFGCGQNTGSSKLETPSSGNGCHWIRRRRANEKRLPGEK